MRKIHLVVLTVLLGGALAIAQSTQTQPAPSQPSGQQQAAPDSNSYPPSSEKTPPYQTAAPQNYSNQPEAQPLTGPSESRTETGPTGQSQPSGAIATRSSVPWVWVVVGLGVLALLLIIIVAGRGSGGTERIERIEHTERDRDVHHDDIGRAA